jgi:hypothetical protein
MCPRVAIQVAVELLVALQDDFDRKDLEESDKYLSHLGHALEKSDDAFEIGVLMKNWGWYVCEYFVIDLQAMDVPKIRKQVYADLLQWWLRSYEPVLKVGDVFQKATKGTPTRYELLKSQRVVNEVDRKMGMYVLDDHTKIEWELVRSDSVVL